MKRDPHAGDLYIFRGRRGDLVKILWHDGLGMSLYAKRLDRGKFIWPSASDGAVSISAAQMAYMLEGIDQIDQMVLFSGDGDFRSLVEAVQRRGVRVTVISTISSQPPMIADELRRQADVFTDLVELQSSLARDPSARPARAASSSAAVPALRVANVSPSKR